MDDGSKDRESGMAGGPGGGQAGGPDEDARMAEGIRARVASLNEALAAAARAGLRVELQQTSHQTSGGLPMTVLEATIYRRL